MITKSVFFIQAALICFFILDPAYAVLNGRVGQFPKDPDEALMKASTIRIVLQQPDGSKIPFCSGMLYGVDQVVTAGHCFKKPVITEALNDGRLLIQVMGPGGGKLIKVAKLNKEFSAKADLALMKLSESHGLGKSIPMALNGCDQGKPLIAAGFGRNQNGERSTVLKYAEYTQHDENVNRASAAATENFLKKNSDSEADAAPESWISGITQPSAQQTAKGCSIFN